MKYIVVGAIVLAFTLLWVVIDEALHPPLKATQCASATSDRVAPTTTPSPHVLGMC